MISAILLAAGLSSRFGSPKALAKLNNTPVVGHVLKTLIESQVNEIVVVLGAHHEEIKPYILNHKKVKFVYNKDYILGQTSSFKAGLNGISLSSKGILLLPVDYPIIKCCTIDEICQNFLSNEADIVIPTHNNIKGHPPVFNVSLKDKFLSLSDSAGINTVIHACPNDVLLVPVKDSGVITSFNTQAELEHIRISCSK